MMPTIKQASILLSLCTARAFAYVATCVPVTDYDLKHTPQYQDRLSDLPKGGKGATDWNISPDGFMVYKQDNLIGLVGHESVWQRNWARVEYDRQPNNDVSATQWYYLDRYRPCLVHLEWYRVAGGQLYHISGSD